MTFKYGFDTTPYFQTVATTLIRRHGEEALALADHAIQKMQMIGNAEGTFLWEGVRSAMYDTVVDAMSGENTGSAGLQSDSLALCH